MQELLDLNAPEREGLLRALKIECIDLGHEQRNLQNYLKGLGKEESPSLYFPDAGGCGEEPKGA